MLHCPRNIMRTISYSGLFLATGLAPAFWRLRDPTGDWRVADGVANIRVAECNGSMWGAVAWEKTPGGRDKNNPDVSKQSRPTLGMPILIDMKKKPRRRSMGRPSLQRQGRTILQFDDQADRPDQLEIKGCVLGFLCGGETWTRVAGPIPCSPANSMAKGAAKTTGAPPSRTAPPRQTAPASGQDRRVKSSAAAHPADPVGDICLIPDIARFAH